MSARLVIYLIIAVAVLLVIAYAIAIYVRKRNESKLAILEEKKEELYNLPVNDEVEAVKNMHLIGQSQVTFREWNQKWLIYLLTLLRISKIIFLRQKAITTHSVFSRPVIKLTKSRVKLP